MSSFDRIPLTRARIRLFQLVDAVLSGETPRVVLSHRGRGEVVLIAAAELKKLDADLAALRTNADVGPLRGLATLNAPLETVLDDIRTRQHALASSKTWDAAGATERPKRAAERRPRGYKAKGPSK